MPFQVIPLMQRVADPRSFAERPALLDAALANESHGLLVLAAPAGYGKSWLAQRIAARWQEAHSRRGMAVRQWNLSSKTTLTQALRSFCELFGQYDKPTLLSPDIAVDTALEAMACSDAPGILVIDMDGTSPNRAVTSLAAQLLAEFAVQGHALLVCRNPWLMPLERISLSATVQVFDAGDLAFDADTLMQFHDIDAAQAQRWMTVTEGWPALCGSRLPVDAHPLNHDDDELTRVLVAHLNNYLEQEVLSSLSARDAQLLMHASIFEAVEPGMLETLGGDISWSRFIALQENGLPLSLARSSRDRIVLHPVFRAFLQRRLQDRSPAIYHSLHRRAALGYAAANNHRLALAHATRTNDPVLVNQITESSGGWRISLREGVHALNRGADQPAISAQFPKAHLARTYWLAQAGRLDEAEHLLTDLQRSPNAADLKLDLETIAAVLRVYRDAPYDEAIASALSTQTRGTPGGALGPGAATIVAAMLNNAALYERAVATSRAAILEASAVGSQYVEFYGQWQCGIALHGLGQVADALKEYDRAIVLAEEVLGEASSEARVVNLDAAHAAYLAGEDDLAERLAGDLTGLYRLHAWFESYARALEVATALARARSDGQLEAQVLQSFADLAEARALPRLAVMVSLGRSQQALAEGDLETASRHCATALQRATSTLQEDLPETIRVLAPVYLEAIRIELLSGRLKEAVALVERTQAIFERNADGSIELEHRLFQAYLDVHGRQFKSAALRLSQCVHQARRCGLVRPFRNNAKFVAELVECARSRALPFDTGVLHAALQMSMSEVAPTPDVRSRGPVPSNGRMLLTEREMDILHFLSDGLSSKEMARRLRISEGTIKTHRKHLYEKLNVGLRSQAITKARELGLL